MIYLFLMKYIFNLQHCVSFKCIVKWFRYIYIYIYSFSDFFLYRLLQDIEYSSLCYTVGPCYLLSRYLHDSSLRVRWWRFEKREPGSAVEMYPGLSLGTRAVPGPWPSPPQADRLDWELSFWEPLKGHLEAQSTEVLPMSFSLGPCSLA